MENFNLEKASKFLMKNRTGERTKGALICLVEMRILEKGEENWPHISCGETHHSLIRRIGREMNCIVSNIGPLPPTIHRG